MVTNHEGLPTAKGTTVVLKVTYFGIHEVVDIEEGFLAMPQGVTRVSTFPTGIFLVVERAASVLGSRKRVPQRHIIRVKVSGSHSKDTVPGLGSGGPIINLFTEACDSGSMVMTVPFDISTSEGRPMGWCAG